MAYSTHYNLPEIPSGAVEWESLYNDLVDKIEVGRTLKTTAGTTMTAGKIFYIDSNSKAQICNTITVGRGIWQTASTNNNAEGFGQISGIMTNTSWNFTSGGNLYSDSSGDLTTVVTSFPVAYALSTNTVVINPPIDTVDDEITHGLHLDSLKVGDDESNYFDIDSNGIATFVGTAKRHLTLRPQLSSSTLIKTPLAVKPTPITLGAFTGFSMPIYNSDEEELYFRLRTPYRWDGNSNPSFKMIIALSAAEDVGDKFKFQLSWNNTSTTGVIEADNVDVETETTVVTDHSAQYSTYIVTFELDYDNAGLQQTMISGNNVVGRIRRIAASSLEVSNEIYIMDWVSVWQVNKIFGNGS
jgi:hypothetical protein